MSNKTAEKMVMGDNGFHEFFNPETGPFAVFNDEAAAAIATRDAQVAAGLKHLAQNRVDAIQFATRTDAGRECLETALDLQGIWPNDLEQIEIHLERAGFDDDDIESALDVIRADDMCRRSVVVA